MVSTKRFYPNNRFLQIQQDDITIPAYTLHNDVNPVSPQEMISAWILTLSRPQKDTLCETTQCS